MQLSGGSIETAPPQSVVIRGTDIDHAPVGQPVGTDPAIADCISSAGQDVEKWDHQGNGKERSNAAHFLVWPSLDCADS